jgi:prepilin-type N-terminal cleavage/methylation domain-containing protein
VPSQRGFTLIEILVVITILGLLMAVILPNVLGAGETANQQVDRVNLTRIFEFMQSYKAKNNQKLPPGGGHRFLLGPWIDDVIPRTEKNRDHYFHPVLRTTDDRYNELAEQDVATIWRRREDVTSADTHYAGRSDKFKQTMQNANEAWAANDNEYGRAWSDGTIHVLMSDGTVKILQKKDLPGWPEADDAEFVYPVGPESGHVLLQKLDK